MYKLFVDASIIVKEVTGKATLSNVCNKMLNNYYFSYLFSTLVIVKYVIYIINTKKY